MSMSKFDHEPNYSVAIVQTAADGVNDAVQVQVIPIWYPSKGAAGAHKIRLIRVCNTETETVSMYAHAADVGGVVERKSNISRLFGKFESPAEKLLMNGNDNTHTSNNNADTSHCTMSLSSFRP